MSTHPILGQIALAYSPVIDRNRIVTATRLTVFPLQQGTRLDAADLLRAIEDLAVAAHQQVEQGELLGPQRDALVAMGCRNAQGYLFGKPMPADQLIEHVAAGPQTFRSATPVAARN